MAHNLLFIHISVIGGHMHIVRVSGLVTFPTMLTGIRGDRDVLALNVIIQVRRLSNETTVVALPLPWNTVQLGHL